MKWFSAVGLFGLLLTAGITIGSADEIINIPLDDKPKSGSATVTKPSSQPAQKTQVKNATAQSAAQSNNQAIGRLGVVSGEAGRIRSSRSDAARLFYECPKGTYLAVTEEKGDWYGILMSDGRTGWIRKSRVSLLDYDVVSAPDNTSPLGQRIVQTAFNYLGVPYRWGGNTENGIDCSGFVKKVFAANGIALPRTAREQVYVGTPVMDGKLLPGDRLYFNCKGGAIDHTGIYIGSNYFIHSSGSRGGVAVDSIFKRMYYNSLIAIRRS